MCNLKQTVGECSSHAHAGQSVASAPVNANSPYPKTERS